MIAPFDAEMRQLWITKLLRRPIQQALSIVEGRYGEHLQKHTIVNGTWGYNLNDQITFLSYNVDDYDIANLLSLLTPSYNFT